MNKPFTVTITKNNALPIPDVILDEMGLKLGDNVYFYKENSHFTIRTSKSKLSKTKKYMGQSVIELI